MVNGWSVFILELKAFDMLKKGTSFAHLAKNVRFSHHRRGISPLTFINSATMLTAISSGVSELISSPMGA